MAPKFIVPKSLEHLAQPPDDDEGETLYAQEVTEIDGLDASEIHRLVIAVVTELADKDVLCVVEQCIFDQLYSLVRGFASLEASARSVLIDSLCTNFVQLNVGTSVLIGLIEDSNEDAEDLLQRARSHRNAIQIYSYFLLSIITAQEAEPEPPKVDRGGSKGRSRKKHVPQDWDWSTLRTRSLKVLAGALQNDLHRIFESRQLDERLISLFAKGAFKLLENRSLLEKAETKDCKEFLWTIISACTVKYGYRISSIVTIIDMLHKYEYLPQQIAELVSFAENQFNGSSLAVDLLRAVGQIDPLNFERDTAGADNVGQFLEELANRLPKLMVTNLSVIMCHLDGKSYKMRNSLVKVIGTLLIKAIKDSDGVAASDVSRLRNEQALLNVLIERSKDVSAHTRKTVLQIWAYLCREHAVPIGHWNLVSDLAAGRLEDNAAIVRKNAVQLLATLLEYNPFGPSLRTAAFEATFEKYKDKLSEMSPREVPANDEVGQTDSEEEINGGDEQMDGSPPGATDSTPRDSGGEERRSQHESDGSSKSQKITSNPQFSPDINGIEHTRALVASLESAVRFSKCIGSSMEMLAQLLDSKTIGDVESTIQLLILCKKFEVDGSAFCLRKTLPLVFSQESGIKSAVEDAFKTLYLKGSPPEIASNLINVTLEASLGDHASIEELVSKCMFLGEISSGTVSALWDFFTFNAQRSTPDQSRAALAVLCMAAKSNPQILSSHLQNILDVGFGRWAKDDVLLARFACIALQRLPEHDRISLRRNHKTFSILSSLIVRPGLSEACWYSAAEQAINAIYALHPTPESFSSELLVRFAHSVFSKIERNASSKSLEQSDHGPDIDHACTSESAHDFSSLSAIAVSRFLFAVAHFALKHLVYIESCLRKVRKQMGNALKSANDGAEKLDANADEEDGGVSKAKEESIAAELGMAAAEDARLDNLADQAESEIVASNANPTILIGAIAPLVTKLCTNSTLMQQNQRLRSSAMLALCKLMAIDASFCEKHLQLLFTVTQNSPEDSVRSNCIIALGDLALRFPNLLEPWMEFFYARVHDQSKSVRKNIVLVLSHLILNDMIKVKGYISEMAIHLEDEDPRISELVKIFFNELSKKGNNPINNLLPDILSRLSHSCKITQEHFNSIMQFLIGTIKKSKQMEGLIEKLCNRFVGMTHPRQWQDIAYCLNQLTYSHNCLKRLVDLFKLYQHALGDVVVINHFKSLIAKARKLAKADVKLVLDELEEKLIHGHNEKKEQEEALQKAQEHHQRLKPVQAQDVTVDVDVSLEGELVADAEEDSSVGEGRIEPESRERHTVVKEEPVEELISLSNSLTGSQSTDANLEVCDEEFDEVVHSKEEVYDISTTDGDEEGFGQEQDDVDQTDHESKRTSKAESIARRIDESVLAPVQDISQLAVSAKDLNSSQPYPYMDLNFESPVIEEELDCVSADEHEVQAQVSKVIPMASVKVEGDIESNESNESEVDDPVAGDENVKAVAARVTRRKSVHVKAENITEVSIGSQEGEIEDPEIGNRTSRSVSRRASYRQSSELTPATRPSTFRHKTERNSGADSQKKMRSFLTVKGEHSSELHERSTRRSKILQPSN